jgi:hypothetical protein
MNLSFTHRGIDYVLHKHPEVRQQLKAGTITEEAARLRPWYLRASWRPTKPFKLSADDAHAIRTAKDILKGHVDEPEKFSAWMTEQDARRGVTLGDLAADWLAAGLPYSKTNPREPAAAERLRATLARALPYWEKIVARHASKHFEQFAGARISGIKYGTGRRTVDVELACLSSLCQWAVLTRRLDENPFKVRPQYVDDKKIEHCHRFMPDNDEQFHAILRHIFASADPLDVIAGAWLTFGALTGLRPHEPGLLLRVPRVNKFPDRLTSEPAGLIFPMPDGSTRMKVYRGKGGQNPTVTIHPILADFLATYTARLDRQPSTPNSQPSTLLFPCPLERLRDVLHDATAALKLGEMHPHGFMRAYYVRVQKSAGKDAAIVAAELGQTTGGSLIRSVYGNPDDPFGGQLYDWAPTIIPPATAPDYAWHALLPAAGEISNIIAL